ncbi:alcohol dehydrogenase catalytic domain-containing protein [Streptomyces sp. RB6PN25]|uniref:Alcohol dehydrogenase catalytic domain-containing protein n=1 Tax=Streptomyces humicola TaxID=2953240 RepID=A0ABT1PVS2_9ACTN|nr:alcohol dehydrogenase catalytic domain-containing protein [Streptomyces humicola]MCQ4080630.1 alcohol dehydrogenase catalytic domain-containing protein [Streptomyces humicola]
MRALVYHGPGESSWDTAPDPGIEDAADAIVRVDTTTICGTDLHILEGDVPEVRPGTVLGHEAVGEVVEVGGGVRAIRPGDRVLVSCISACGRCRFCRQAMYGQCRGGGGWVLGHLINGTQAEYVRVPFAEMSTYPLMGGMGDEAAVLLADILPTAYEVGVLKGGVRPGDTVVVVGAGPIGLAAILTAQLYSPGRIVAVDLAPARMEAAKQLGADVVADAAQGPEQLVDDLTDGLGADVAIEAVGVPESFELCTRVVRPGGRVANIGVHGRSATLHLEDLWIKDVTISTGLVDTYSTPDLLRMVAAGRLQVSSLVTHAFGFDRIKDAYDVFSHPADTAALKVALHREPSHESLLPQP